MTSAFRKPIPRPRQSKLSVHETPGTTTTDACSASGTETSNVASSNTFDRLDNDEGSQSNIDPSLADYVDLLDKPVPPPRRSKLSLPSSSSSSSILSTPRNGTRTPTPEDADLDEATAKAHGDNESLENPEYMELSQLRRQSTAVSNTSGHEGGESHVLEASDLDFFDPLHRSAAVASATTAAAEPEVADFDQLRLDFGGAVQCEDHVDNGDQHLTAASESDMLRSSLEMSGQSICYSGWVEAFSAKQQRWWCVLRNGILQFMQSDDPDADSDCDFQVICSRIVYLSKEVDESDRRSATKDQPGFVLNFKKSDKHPIQKIVLFTADEVCRDVWLMLIAKCIAQEMGAADYVEEVEQAGTVYVKQGTTSNWRVGWAFMTGKSLSYTFKEAFCYQIDLRKVFEIKLSTQSTERCNFVSLNQIGPIVISQKDSSVYLQTTNDAITQAWFKSISKEALRLTNRLEDQRFTAEDIPHIVDKCVRFLALYGMNHEGIYRKSGQLSQVRKLMDDFHKDAAQVHLVYENDESVNTVAEVLRRFFRQLEEPLISNQRKFYDIGRQSTSDTGGIETKVAQYQSAVEELAHVNYVTLRLLLGHLKEVTDHSADNKATVINVAKVFAPTLFSTEQGDDQSSSNDRFRHMAHEITALHDLILYYNAIFKVTEEEAITRSRVMTGSSPAQKKSVAGGFLIPIHMFEKDNEAFNMEDGRTASEVLDFAVKHKNLDPHQQYAVFEVVNNGALERPLRPNEPLREVVVNRWYSWSDKTLISCSYLLIKRDKLVGRLTKTVPNAFAGELRFAEIGSKSFRKAQFECSQGQICYYKDSKKATPQHKWKVEEVIWYLGHDPKRDPHFPYTVSLLDLTLTAQPGKLFGMCLCFKEEQCLITWLATIASLQGYWSSAETDSGVKLIDA